MSDAAARNRTGFAMEQSTELDLFLRVGSGPWTVVRESIHQDGVNYGIYCALGDPGRRMQFLREPAWDLSITSGSPGFSQHSENGEWVTTYHRNWDEHGVEPFALYREFHGAREDYVEIQQEFRLFHNLAYDGPTGNLIMPNTDGTEDVAVKYESGRVLVRTKLLKQYLAARQMDLHLYIDSVLYGNEGETPPEEWSIRNDGACIELYASADAVISKKPFTRMLGKRIIAPGPMETCGVWPFEPEEHYPEFIIGEDEHGRPVYFTSDPDQLANYFGKNPEAPHYLTPVHFRKEVLQKYYDRPELYTVGDGRLQCASLWGCQIDNDHDDRVTVFLGDLGRDLPENERDYWRGFMITPDVTISDTNLRRSFLGQFADPKTVDLLFKRQYDEVNEAWAKTFGWPLFRAPEGPDKQLVNRLRLPLNDSQAEFESAIRVLTQLLVDALNEKSIEASLETKRTNEKGISKLERLFKQEDYPHLDDVRILRRLQELRSKVTAHRKGSDYEEVLNKNLGSRRGREAVALLIQELLDLLNRAKEWAEERASRS